MKGFRRVALLLGGSSDEREISLMSGKEVGDALRRTGYDVVDFDPGQRPIGEIRDEGVEAAFVILHGGSGENGAVQGILGEFGIPFTGSGLCACALAMDKHFTKLVWRAEGLPTPDHRVLKGGGEDAARKAGSDLGYPVFVKPRRGGSSIASRKAEDYMSLLEAVADAVGTGDDALVEPCIDGDEVTFTILDGRVLPSIRIAAKSGFYDYEAKYFSDETGYECPSGIPSVLESELGALSLRAYKALDCCGWGRVDLILDRDSRPHLLEVNTVPGMTTHSLVPMAAKAVGIGFDDLVSSIMENAGTPS